MDWRFRLAVRTALHFLPFKYHLRKLKWSLSKNPFPQTPDVLYRGLSFIAKMEKNGFTFTDSTVLEIGPGWEPTIPILLFLKGCGTIMLFDVHRLLNPITLRHSLHNAKQFAGDIADSMKIPKQELVAKLNGIDPDNLSNALNQLNVQYHAPADASDTALDANSIDLIFSHTVLEHIPPAVLEAIFSEAHRILRPGGKMCHLIDNSDHWAHYDKNITFVNFLTFEESTWRFIGINPLDYQNRLRYYEYVSLFTRHSFTIEQSDYTVDEKSLHFIKTHALCRKYRDVPAEELAKTAITIIAGK